MDAFVDRAAELDGLARHHGLVVVFGRRRSARQAPRRVAAAPRRPVLAGDRATKSELLAGHCGAVFEDWVRGRHPGARRYWDGSVELDMVREEPRRGGAPRLVVSEIKWRTSAAESQRLLSQLAARFHESGLARHHRDVRFELIDSSALPKLARLER